MSRKACALAAALTLFAGLVFAAYFQSFETDTFDWTGATRVMTTTHGVPSKAGAFHPEDQNLSGLTFTRWGGYSRTFPPGGYTVGTGVLMEEDGGAEGVFHAVLQGRSALGQPQQITITGKVDAGSLSPEGGADFRGTALIDLGDGTAPLPGVPFTVAATAGSLVLGIDSTTLPAAQVTSGVVAIE